jgi:putative transposase
MYINQGHSLSVALAAVSLPRSVYYYRSSNAAKGRRTTAQTRTSRGDYVGDSEVVATIETELETEFIDYGYLKMTYHLRRKYGYIINRKKVYRLMKAHRLLYKPLSRPVGNKTWVQHCVPVVEKPFSFWEFDIKYIAIAGERINALMLTVIDVKTRIVLGWILQHRIQKYDVIQLLATIFMRWQLPESITVRTDNGSQFEAQLVRDYLKEMNVTQEFCHPATPEQNGHIESYHSIIERSICRRYEFANLNEAKQTMERFVAFYCAERIHSGIGYTSPFSYALALGVDAAYLCRNNGTAATSQSPHANADEGKTNPKVKQSSASEKGHNNTLKHPNYEPLSTSIKSRISVQL